MTGRRLRPIGALAAFAMGAALPAAAAVSAPIGFYVPWDTASLASLRQHGERLQAVVPAWISVTGPEHEFAITPDIAGHAALAALNPKPKLWLMVQNARLGQWDGAGAASLLQDAGASAALLDRLEAEMGKEKASGVVIDLESLPAGAQPDLLRFLATARERFGRQGWTVAVTAPVADPAWDLAALARAADRVILMAYDEHWQTGKPGPIAGNPWFASAVAHAMAQLPPDRAVVAIASYAYDWPASGPATVLSIAQAEALAVQAGVRPTRDRDSGGAHFTYLTNGVRHDVWMADAASVQAQTAVAGAAGARDVALWRLGSEDPAIWSGGPWVSSETPAASGSAR